VFHHPKEGNMTITLFENKRILLGVTGSIACYKAADLASKLRQTGALVDVILTQAATEFITPLTFESVTGRRAYIDEDLWGREGHVVHVGLAEGADLMIIAPCTANTLAKLAAGQANNLLSLTVLAARCPLLLAPAMDGGMYTNPATQANVQTLTDRGAKILEPGTGHLASGLMGPGRLQETKDLVGQVRLALAANGRLKGRNLVVTAAGTQEPIDPVRFLTNHSTGKQGFALAQVALDMGASVTLISGPSQLATPHGAVRVDVETAAEMEAAVLNALPGADALLMAAAVADFSPTEAAPNKLKKRDGIPTIALQSTPDILVAVDKFRTEHGFPRVSVGFAAESQDLLANARSKLASKNVDLIAANSIGVPDSGFAVDTNRVTLLFASGVTEVLPVLTKTEVAQIILDHVVTRLEEEA
jgi:phosphopantothenoylcysteine decarboxylase/phosphopantothenate--cysteine ligase